MRHLAFILILTLINCKSDKKKELNAKVETEKVLITGNGIDKSVYDMWNNYKESNPEFKKDELPDSDFFHDNKKDANHLAKLIVNEKKKASSGLYIWYRDANADLPKIGTKLIVTDFDGIAQAIIETKFVDTIPFNEISNDYAEMDTGTTIKPLEKWKKAHWEFFAKALKQNGQRPTNEMLVVCERFEKIWPKH
ncbi:ASCH domain-containing protein [Winogradskyella costae]|uniref:ASCH domain-containing protein n=1 Tax=Winogradskyella costae TaxID=2697008 RepID=UPI0015CB5C9D|nr:ASCH domain-containing protein [Winogradskyella costae]